MKTLTQTEKLILKVEVAIDRNHRALQSAAAKGDEPVVQLCAAYHWRLRRIENYLESRLAR